MLEYNNYHFEIEYHHYFSQVTQIKQVQKQYTLESPNDGFVSLIKEMQ